MADKEDNPTDEKKQRLRSAAIMAYEAKVRGLPNFPEVKDKSTFDEIDAIYQLYKRREEMAKYEGTAENYMKMSYLTTSSLMKLSGATQDATTAMYLSGMTYLAGKKAIQEELTRLLDYAHALEQAQPEVKKNRKHLFCIDKCRCSYLYQLEIKQCAECQAIESEILNSSLLTGEKCDEVLNTWYYQQRRREAALWLDEQNEKFYNTRKMIIERLMVSKPDPVAGILSQLIPSLITGKKIS